MYRVRKAIYDFYIADAMATGLPAIISGGLHYERVDEAPYPYGVHNFIGGAMNDTGRVMITDCLWQLRFYDDAHANPNIISGAMSLAQKMFYGAIIENVTEWRNFDMVRCEYIGDPFHESKDPEAPIVVMSSWEIKITPCI